MIETIKVENFRCFERLSLSGLSRINIIVGKNGSGKTALLESLLLSAAGNSEIAFKMRSWRGLGEGFRFTSDRKSYESIWKDLFFALDQSRTISISLRGSLSNTRSVQAFYRSDASLTLPLQGEILEDVASIVPITFEWTDAHGEKTSSQPRLGKEGFSLGGVSAGIPMAFFSSVLRADPTENADRFSQLSKNNKEGLIIEALQQEFPFIKNLSVEINGGVAMVYGQLATLPEKIPIANISAGVNKLLGILLAIANFPKGVILIDEIDNGFYYDRLSTIWSSLLVFCKRYDTQIFATTHSLECIRAALPSLSKHASDFSLWRTEKENSQVVVRQFSGKDLKGSIEQESEIR